MLVHLFMGGYTEGDKISLDKNHVKKDKIKQRSCRGLAREINSSRSEGTGSSISSVDLE